VIIAEATTSLKLLSVSEAVMELDPERGALPGISSTAPRAG